jgi:tyrosinase
MKHERRIFIKNTLLLTGGLFLQNDTFSKTMIRKSAASRIRKEINTLSATDPDLLAYKKAVSVMKQRPASDPTSWSFQAKIHQNFCPHRNWFFLPWHRAYLKQFEEICRAASGQPDFNLPYWNWTKNRSVPATFWGANNVLMDSSRRINAQSKALEEMVGTINIEKILNKQSFEDFGSYAATSQRPTDGSGASGSLEGSPHNHIHNFIGGNMGSFISPTDPIFWLHHANIDRLWATWNDRGHANPTKTTYTNYIFKKNFNNASGQAVDIKTGDMSDQNALGYLYDTQLSGPRLGPVNSSSFAFISSTKLVNSNQFSLNEKHPTSINLTGFKKLYQSAFPQVTSSLPTKSREVKAIISDINPLKEEDYFVRVFIDYPNLNKDTPISDKHYVGSFAFFASEHGDHPAAVGGDMKAMHTPKLTYVFDITNNLKQLFLGNSENLKDDIKIQLLAIPYRANGKAALIAGKVEIVIAQKEV